MSSYQILYLTDNGAVFGTFDSYDEFVKVFKEARAYKCPCITRCVNSETGKVLKSKVFDKTYMNEFTDQIEMLREAIGEFTKP